MKKEGSDILASPFGLNTHATRFARTVKTRPMIMLHLCELMLSLDPDLSPHKERGGEGRGLVSNVRRKLHRENGTDRAYPFAISPPYRILDLEISACMEVVISTQ